METQPEKIRTLTIRRCSGTSITIKIPDHDFEEATLKTILPTIATELTNILREEFKRGDIKYLRGAVPPGLLKFINLAFSDSPVDDRSPTTAAKISTAEPFVSLDTQLDDVDFENVLLMVQDLSPEEQTCLEEAGRNLEKKKQEGLEKIAKIDYDAIAARRRWMQDVRIRAPFDHENAVKQAKHFFPDNKLEAQTDWYTGKMQEEIFKTVDRRCRYQDANGYVEEFQISPRARARAPAAGPAANQHGDEDEPTSWTSFDPFNGVMEPSYMEQNTTGKSMSTESLKRVRELLYLMPAELFHSKDAFRYVDSIGPYRRPTKEQIARREYIEHVRRGSILDWVCSVCLIFPDEKLFSMVWEYLEESNGGTVKNVVVSLKNDVSEEKPVDIGFGFGGLIVDTKTKNRELGPVLTPLRDVAELKFRENVAKILTEVIEAKDEIGEKYLRKFLGKPMQSQFWMREVYAKIPYDDDSDDHEDETKSNQGIHETSYLTKLTNAMWRHPYFEMDASLADQTPADFSQQQSNLSKLMSEGGKIIFARQLLEKQKENMKKLMSQGRCDFSKELMVYFLEEDPANGKDLWAFIQSDNCPVPCKKFAFDTIFRVWKNGEGRLASYFAETTVSPLQQCLIKIMQCTRENNDHTNSNVTVHGEAAAEDLLKQLQWTNNYRNYYDRSAVKKATNLLETVLPESSDALREQIAKEFEKRQESDGFEKFMARHLPERFRRGIAKDIKKRGYISLERYAAMARAYVHTDIEGYLGNDHPLVSFFDCLQVAVAGLRPWRAPVRNKSEVVQQPGGVENNQAELAMESNLAELAMESNLAELAVENMTSGIVQGTSGKVFNGVEKVEKVEKEPEDTTQTKSVLKSSKEPNTLKVKRVSFQI